MAPAPSGREAVLAALSDVITVTPADNAAQQHLERYEPASSFSGAKPMAISEPPPMVPSKNPFENQNLPPPPKPTAKSGMAGKFAKAFRRQTGEEKEARRRAKEERMREEISKSTTKSSKIDVIDRLDLSGINGASMFHHDSPYDACSPQANRGKRAPVKAFDPNVDPLTGLPYANARSDRKGRGPSPLANSTTDFDEENSTTSASRPSIGTDGSRAKSFNTPAVPSLSMNPDGSSTDLAVPVDHEVDPDANADAERAWKFKQGYHTQPSTIPDSRHDVSNPNADVWGVSAEPWQDFAHPKSPDAGGRSTLSPYSAFGGERSGTASAASSVLDMEAIMTGRKTSSSPRTQEELARGSASPFPERNWAERAATSDAPKRSKSLIKRIKSMKENPNVPALEDGVEMSAIGARRRRGASAHKHSPSTPPLNSDSDMGYNARGNIDATNYSRKASGPLEESPQEGNADHSLADRQSSGRTGRSGELGRSGSIFNKFKRSQKSSKSMESPAAYA